MSDELVVQSHAGPYSVHFGDEPVKNPGLFATESSHPVIDANVAMLYKDALAPLISHPNAIVIEATEENKSLDRIVRVFERLVANRIRRDHTLVAVGGGIVQDVTCFIASTILRGVSWRFVPTTLLAQADSCIGSKSSINLGSAKNIVGTFYPPADVWVHSGFLDTLKEKDIRSGIGEIIKVHAIDGPASFDRLGRDFDSLPTDRSLLQRYIHAALEIKRRYIEQDEFDRGIRNIFNFGHSFGHAIESATCYSIPHGVAISIGMDMANFVATERGVLPRRHHERMHGVLAKNYREFAKTPIPVDAMLSALLKDKKNTANALGLILATGDDAKLQRTQVVPDEKFRKQCATFLQALAA